MPALQEDPRFERTITVAITGASGSIYGVRLLMYLVKYKYRIFLLLSDAAKVVLKQELDMALPDSPEETAAFFTSRFSAEQGQIVLYGKDDWFSPVASGSGAPKHMIICPCTAGTLSSIAHGSGDSLLKRAADVVLKERSKLVVVLRETPLSPIHLENMLILSRLGAVILPAMPGFYNRPSTVEEVADTVVSRAPDHLGVSHDITRPWGGN